MGGPVYQGQAGVNYPTDLKGAWRYMFKDAGYSYVRDTAAFFVWEILFLGNLKLCAFEFKYHCKIGTWGNDFVSVDLLFALSTIIYVWIRKIQKDSYLKSARANVFWRKGVIAYIWKRCPIWTFRMLDVSYIICWLIPSMKIKSNYLPICTYISKII